MDRLGAVLLGASVRSGRRAHGFRGPRVAGGDPAMSTWRPEGGGPYRVEHVEHVEQAEPLEHTDEWYQRARREEQALWYPDIPPDEAPDARAARRAAYAEAVDATRCNLPPISAGFFDPVSLQQLIPPRRGQVQGPGASPDELDAAAGAQPRQAAKTSVS